MLICILNMCQASTGGRELQTNLHQNVACINSSNSLTPIHIFSVSTTTSNDYSFSQQQLSDNPVVNCNVTEEASAEKYEQILPCSFITIDSLEKVQTLNENLTEINAIGKGLSSQASMEENDCQEFEYCDELPKKRLKIFTKNNEKLDNKQTKDIICGLLETDTTVTPPEEVHDCDSADVVKNTKIVARKHKINVKAKCSILLQNLDMLERLTNRNYLQSKKRNGKVRLSRDLCAVKNYNRLQRGPKGLSHQSLFETEIMDEQIIIDHFFIIDDDKAELLNADFDVKERGEIAQDIVKELKEYLTYNPLVLSSEIGCYTAVNATDKPEVPMSLNVVSELIEIFCVNVQCSKVCLIKLEILELMPNFHELPLFLDLIKFACFDGSRLQKETKLKVLNSLLLNTKYYLRYNACDKTYTFENSSIDQFVLIARTHILRYLKIEGRNRKSYVYYSHAMAMKLKQGLTEIENASIDVILYAAFIIRNLDEIYADNVSTYPNVSTHLVALYKGSDISNSYELLNINSFAPQGTFRAHLLIRIIRYMTECRKSCNLPAKNYSNWYFYILQKRLVVIEKCETDHRKYIVQFFDSEAIVMHCMNFYRGIVVQVQQHG